MPDRAEPAAPVPAEAANGDQDDAQQPAADIAGPPREPSATDLAAAIPAHPAQAWQIPEPMRLRYELSGRSKGLSYSADAVLDWRQDGQRYQAMLEISAFLVGSRSQTSSGHLGPEGLQPERFVDRARRERVTQFDHAAGLARTEAGSALNMPAGTQDRLSVFIQLALKLSGRDAPAAGESWTLPVAGSRAIESWTFDWLGVEALALPDGPMLTWHLERKPAPGGSTRVDIWLAPELGWLPARLRLQQDNDSIDQRLRR
jgi:hypothetical protein